MAQLLVPEEAVNAAPVSILNKKINLFSFPIFENFFQDDNVRYLLDSFPCFVFWKNRHSVYQGCNKQFANQFGHLNPNELVGRSDYDLPFSKGEAKQYRSDDQKVMDEKIPKLNYQETQRQLTGEQKIVLASKVPIYDKHCSVVGVMGMYVDITEEYCQETTLSENKILSLSTTSKNNDKNKYCLGAKYPGIYLTNREIDCAYYLIMGCTAKEIASKLCLSPRTVEHYIGKLKIKLNVNTRSKLILVLMECGIFELGARNL